MSPQEAVSKEKLINGACGGAVAARAGAWVLLRQSQLCGFKKSSIPVMRTSRLPRGQQETGTSFPRGSL